ncbi:MAG: hypothetical protein HN975_02020 [Anaerolineae bacterium]|jgi:hypothetical protein|nr:hypothetical protein [Anaerolineae bacterium]
MPDRIDLRKSNYGPLYHYPAAATIATRTMPATAEKKNVLTSVKYSYSAAPTGGKITIAYTKGGASISEELDDYIGGPRRVPLDEEIVGDVNTAIVVSLASGAGTVVGKVIVSGYQIPG